jgi:hypothetical protein
MRLWHKHSWVYDTYEERNWLPECNHKYTLRIPRCRHCTSCPKHEYYDDWKVDWPIERIERNRATPIIL